MKMSSPNSSPNSAKKSTRRTTAEKQDKDKDSLEPEPPVPLDNDTPFSDDDLDYDENTLIPDYCHKEGNKIIYEKNMTLFGSSVGTQRDVARYGDGTFTLRQIVVVPDPISKRMDEGVIRKIVDVNGESYFYIKFYELNKQEHKIWRKVAYPSSRILLHNTENRVTTTQRIPKGYEGYHTPRYDNFPENNCFCAYGELWCVVRRWPHEKSYLCYRVNQDGDFLDPPSSYALIPFNDLEDYREEMKTLKLAVRRAKKPGPKPKNTTSKSSANKAQSGTNVANANEMDQGQDASSSV